MTTLWPDGPSIERIQEDIAAGWIRAGEHQDHPALRILNYTHKAMWKHHWTAETMACRGLIVDVSTTPWRVVQRPFGKFFNLGDMSEHVPTVPDGETFTVHEKYDGWLGIAYMNGDRMAIATRGSFHSPGAQAGTLMLQQYPEMVSLMRSRPNWTYLFEIIHPWTSVVVDYGDREELVLLAVIDNATGRDATIVDGHPMPVAERHNFGGLSDPTDLFDARFARPNAEGYVIQFESGVRFKIKHDLYQALHRAVTGITPKRVWKHMAEGGDSGDLGHPKLPGFNRWVDQIATSISSDYHRALADAKADLAAIDTPKGDGSRKTRGEMAQEINQSAYPHIAFALMDGRDPSPMLWKLARPAHGQFTTYKRDEAS